MGARKRLSALRRKASSRFNSATDTKGNRQNSGFSLVEALIAIAIISLIVVVIGGSLSTIHRLYAASSMKTEALGLATEALDIMSEPEFEKNAFACMCSDPSCTNCSCTPLAGYNSCWLTVSAGVFYLKLDGSLWELTTDPGQAIPTGDYKRKIYITDVSGDSNRKKINVEIWNASETTNLVSLSKIIAGWRKL